LTVWFKLAPKAASASFLAVVGGPGFQDVLRNLKIASKETPKMAQLWFKLAPKAALASFLAVVGGPRFQVA